MWLLGIFNFCMLAGSYAYAFSAPARDRIGDYRRGLLTMAAPMIVGAAIMLHLRRL